MENILVLGGDLRQVYLSQMLEKKGYTVFRKFNHESSTKNLSELLEICSLILCPIPFSKDNKSIFSNEVSEELSFDFLITHLKKSHKIIGGNIPKSITTKFDSLGISYVDISTNNEIAIKNAVATAEGTICEAIKNSTINLHNSQCLVTGYGRCGSVLAKKLSCLDCVVTIFDKDKEKLFYGKSLGHRTVSVDELEKNIHTFDFIFNTVPAPVITENLIKKMKKHVTIIDIASNPGGTDWECCKDLNISAHSALGLPGKYSPKTSAQILFETIITLI